MKPMANFKKNEKIKLAMIGVPLAIVYSVAINVFIDFFMSCSGILVFAVLVIFLIVFVHFLFEDYRKSQGKYVYYPSLLYAILMLMWMVCDTIAHCG